MAGCDGLQMQQLLRNPNMIEEVMSHEDILHPQKDQFRSCDSYGHHKTETKKKGTPFKTATGRTLRIITFR